MSEPCDEIIIFDIVFTRITTSSQYTDFFSAPAFQIIADTQSRDVYFAATGSSNFLIAATVDESEAITSIEYPTKGPAFPRTFANVDAIDVDDTVAYTCVQPTVCDPISIFGDGGTEFGSFQLVTGF